MTVANHQLLYLVVYKYIYSYIYDKSKIIKINLIWTVNIINYNLLSL